MGCDIHMMRQVQREDGRWLTVPDARWTFYPKESPDDKLDLRHIDDHNYAVFAVLAGVRNSDGITPIDEPRGLPADVEEEYAPFINHLFGDHSFSWVTAEELLAYDWDQTVETQVVVSRAQADAYLARGEKPTSWCRGTNDPTAVTIRWPRTVREMTGDWIESFRYDLTEFGRPVRLVFGFDS